MKRSFLKRSSIILAILLLVTLAAPGFALAGVGHSTSYSHSSSSHSYSGSSHSYSSAHYGSPGSGGGVGTIILIVIILVIIYAVKRKTGVDLSDPDSLQDVFDDMGAGGVRESAAGYDNSISILKQSDPNFSEPAFLTKVNNLYLQLQDSWMKKEWKPIRVFETDELFNMHARQLQQLIDTKTTNVMEDICVLNSYLRNYESDPVNDILNVVLEARLRDYVISDDTEKVVKGDKNEEIYMTYLLKFIRKKGIVTNIQNQTKSSQCPNCGAPISVNASGQCEYCGTVVTSGEYDWVLSSLSVLNQRNA